MTHRVSFSLSLSFLSLLLLLFPYSWEDSGGNSKTISLQLLLQIDQACTLSLSIHIARFKKSDHFNASHSGLGIEDLDWPAHQDHSPPSAFGVTGSASGWIAVGSGAGGLGCCSGICKCIGSCGSVESQFSKGKVRCAYLKKGKGMPDGQIISQSITIKCTWKEIDPDENNLRKL